MASDLQIQGEVVVNSEKAESAFDRVGDKAQQMATDVATSAGKAGQAVDKIGDGAGASAEKFTRAESRMRDAIKRSTQELQLLGKTASEKLEFNIQAKGLDASKFAPYIEELKKAEQAQKIATGGLDKMGISAAQTTAALRGVPAQFTDIITSLQGGQAPLTVFLQQGGQLKDMFGGAGAAARALGGYVAGLISPFTVAAASGAALAYAYSQGSKEADSYNKALITTGNAAGTNAAQLKAYAQEISAVVGTQGKAAESLAALASTGKIGAESLKEAAQAAVQYERATGQALDKTADQFASLRNEPLAAVLKLNDGMNFLTDSTYKQIKSLEEQGKTAEAANVAQRAFADTLSGRAGEMERNLGSVERGWIKVKDAAKGAWDAILNVGRASTSVDNLAEVRRQIALKESQIANAGFAENEGGAAFGRPSLASTERLRAELAGLQAQAAALEGVAYASRTAAEEERKRGEQVKATAAFDKAGEKFLTDKARMERELAAARVQGAEAGKSQAEIEQRLAQIRESYAKKGGGSSGIAAENKELRDQMRVFADLAGVSSTYYADLANAQKQRAAGVITEQQYVQVVEALIQKQPFAVAIAKKQADATKAQAQASEEAARAHLKYVESFGKGAAAAQQQADQLRTEEAAAAIAARGYYSLAQAIELVTIARLEEKRDGLMGNEEAYLAVQKEIDARKELLTLIGSKEARKSADESAKDATRDWERAAADINRSLTDALLRGFESGKGFARNLRDTIKNMFNTLVLRPIIQFVVQPLADGIMGVVQGGMNAVRPGGSSNLLGMASNGSSLYSLATGGSIGAGIAGSLGSSITAIGTAIGSTAATSFGAGMAGATLAPGLAGPTTVGATGAMGAGASAGSFLSAIPGWGWALAGVGALFGGDIINGLFGRKLKDSGIEGTFGGASGFEGRRFEYYKGGLFRSNKTKYKDLDEETRAALANPFNAMRSNVKEMAGVLGLGTQAIDDFTANFKVSLKGLSAEEADKRLKEEFDKVAESLASTALGTDDYTRAGETAVQTLTRLSGSLTGVNLVFKNLGTTLYESSLAGADMASQLVDLFGGMDGFNRATNAYYQNFYSDSERRDVAKRQLQDAFSSVGLEMPDIDDKNARKKFRELAESLDLTTESGRKAWAMMMSVSGAFAELTPAAQSAQDAISKVVSAQQGVADALSKTGESIGQLMRDAIDSSGSAEEASRKASQSFEQQFYDNAFTGLTDSIGAMIQGGIIAPMMESLLAGATASSAALAAGGVSAASAMTAGGVAGASASAAGGAIAGGTMSAGGSAAASAMISGGVAVGQMVNSVLDNARVQITNFRTILSDPEVQQGIRDVSGLIGEVTGDLYGFRQEFGGGGSFQGGSFTGASSSAQSAADSLSDALKRLGETMGNEVKRLRGLMVDDSAQSQAVLLARFTSSTAAARAGDIKAAEALPELSKLLETATAASAMNSVELARMRGWLAGSLEETAKIAGIKLPEYAIGTNYVPRTMAAIVHEGEAVVPKAFNPWAGGTGGTSQMSTARLEALVERLTDDNRNHAAEIARLSLRVARVLEGWEAGGTPQPRTERWEPVV